MIIAVACDGSAVTGHFGHCQSFAFFTAENGVITKEESCLLYTSFEAFSEKTQNYFPREQAGRDPHTAVNPALLNPFGAEHSSAPALTAAAYPVIRPLPP